MQEAPSIVEIKYITIQGTGLSERKIINKILYTNHMLTSKKLSNQTI